MAERHTSDAAMAIAARRVWLQAIAVIALLIAWVADVIQGYHTNDFFILGAIVVIALGGHILDTVAGPIHAYPNSRELLVYFTLPVAAGVSPFALLARTDALLVWAPALVLAAVSWPFVAYVVLYLPSNLYDSER